MTCAAHRRGAAVLVVSLLISAAAGRWLTRDPPADHPALVSLSSVTAVQCGVLCAGNPLCVAIKHGGPQETSCELVTCRPDWHAFDGGCYRVFTKSLMWMAAEAECGSVFPGGHLVSIASRAENEFVSTIALESGPYFHIGLYWTREGGQRWTDGSAVTFTAWYRNQPNDHRGSATVGTNLATAVKQWNDMKITSTSFSHGFVCEYRLVGK